MADFITEYTIGMKLCNCILILNFKFGWISLLKIGVYSFSIKKIQHFCSYDARILLRAIEVPYMVYNFWIWNHNFFLLMFRTCHQDIPKKFVMQNILVILRKWKTLHGDLECLCITSAFFYSCRVDSPTFFK